MGKRINSNLYTFTKIVFGKHKLYYEKLENNCLYSKLRYPTKITPDDLPEWFVPGRYYKNQGFISSKGVKDLVYVPNYFFNHFFRDDWLYISYDKPIEEVESEDWSGKPCKDYKGYDEAISGNDIVNFIVAVKKFSKDVEVGDIEQEIIRKAEWFLKRFPYDAEAEHGDEYVRYLKKIFELE